MKLKGQIISTVRKVYEEDRLVSIQIKFESGGLFSIFVEDNAYYDENEEKQYDLASLNTYVEA